MKINCGDTLYKHEKDTRKHKYLVGYTGENQCLYDFKETDIHSRTWVNPLTIFQANQFIKKLASDDAEKAIYELVPIKIIKGKK